MSKRNSVLAAILVTAVGGLAPNPGGAEAKQSASVRIEACSVSGWEAESHTLFGDKQAITKKLAGSGSSMMEAKARSTSSSTRKTATTCVQRTVLTPRPSMPT